MPMRWRRISISSRSETRRRSRPSKRTSPAVGSTSRDRQRTSVDLPEPDSPMMTKISPGLTARLASITAGIEAGGGELLGRRARGRRARKASAPGPKSFQRLRQASFGLGRSHRRRPRGVYWPIQAFQRASLAAIQSATTASTLLAVEVDRGDHLRPSRRCRR